LAAAGNQISSRSISDIRKRKQTCVMRPVIVNPSPPTLLELDFARKPQGLRAFFFGPALACFHLHDTRFAYFRDGAEKLCRIKALGRNSHTFPQSCPHLLWATSGGSDPHEAGPGCAVLQPVYCCATASFGLNCLSLMRNLLRRSPIR
jgi:hypothetical protein